MLIFAPFWDDRSQAPEIINGLRTPAGLIVCAKQPSFALGLLLHRLCAGRSALYDYPMGWQVGCLGCCGCCSMALAPVFSLQNRLMDPLVVANTLTHTRARAHTHTQNDNHVVSYPPSAVPRLDSAAVPLDVCEVVRRLLLCNPLKRATVGEALAAVARPVPLGILSGSGLALSTGSSSRGPGTLN